MNLPICFIKLSENNFNKIWMWLILLLFSTFLKSKYILHKLIMFWNIWILNSKKQWKDLKMRALFSQIRKEKKEFFNKNHHTQIVCTYLECNTFIYTFMLIKNHNHTIFFSVNSIKYFVLFFIWEEEMWNMSIKFKWWVCVWKKQN